MLLAFEGAKAYLKVREASVPEGHATIAQRFNVRIGAGRSLSPDEGTVEGIRAIFIRLFAVVKRGIDLIDVTLIFSINTSLSFWYNVSTIPKVLLGSSFF